MSAHRDRMGRREFLTAVGKAVGGSAMLRVMAAMGISSTLAACGSSSAASPGAPTPGPPPPVSRSPSPRPEDWPANVGSGKTVAILGAGISGMVAAWEMSRLGYSCTVLEAQSSAGGRVKTLRSGDVVSEIDSTQVCQFDIDESLYFTAGPSRIAHHHELLLGYCREFGVELETFINDNHAAWLHSPNRFGGQPQVARTLLADTRGGMAELLSSAINQNALDQALTESDKANLLSMLRQYGDLDAGNVYRGTTRAGFPGHMDSGSRARGELLSVTELQQLVIDFFWEQRLSFTEGLNQQPTMLQPVGGMDRIARAFESRLLDQLVFEARVVEIRKTTTGTRVVYEDRSGAPNSLDTDYCIVTIPAPVLASIANDFSAAHQAEIAGFAYTSAVRAAFQSPRFWEQDHNLYGGITWTAQDITQVWYPSHGFQRANGILVAAYIFGGSAGDAFTALSPQARLDRSLSQASSVHPQLDRDATNGISVAWKKMPFQLGAWGASTSSVLLTADDNVFFAGEHLSILQGWQEGAVLSAYAAVDGVVARDINP
ncbi:MAG: FAD-dependent oxidoreductase [Pseudomonadota bacterium]